ncbi:unnamed protein product [Chondrus crispus]|uniref:Uncharacterized protein n=1 Tax=Chondrus crispus TaxID=2769 RepID=R7QLR1_CHOCR|nr:unnamed protein product [Chondrus crispus]CDF38335.1 unnamed protein product [Chondrus crispus]|eukprot:XP_005718220.1 unnamed protein product [Chondrus crispus]
MQPIRKSPLVPSAPELNKLRWSGCCIRILVTSSSPATDAWRSPSTTSRSQSSSSSPLSLLAFASRRMSRNCRWISLISSSLKPAKDSLWKPLGVRFGIIILTSPLTSTVESIREGSSSPRSPVPLVVSSVPSVPWRCDGRGRSDTAACRKEPSVSISASGMSWSRTSFPELIILMRTKAGSSFSFSKMRETTVETGWDTSSSNSWTVPPGKPMRTGRMSRFSDSACGKMTSVITRGRARRLRADQHSSSPEDDVVVRAFRREVVIGKQEGCCAQAPKQRDMSPMSPTQPSSGIFYESSVRNIP